MELLDVQHGLDEQVGSLIPWWKPLKLYKVASDTLGEPASEHKKSHIGFICLRLIHLS
jgi:hypothetical protein